MYLFTPNLQTVKSPVHYGGRVTTAKPVNIFWYLGLEKGFQKHALYLTRPFFFCRTKAAYVRQTLHVWLIFTSLNFCSVTHRFSAEHFETLIESCTIYFRSYCTFVPLLFLKICVPFFFFSSSQRKGLDFWFGFFSSLWECWEIACFKP